MRPGRERCNSRYLDVCPPSLQPTGERIWQRSQPIRPFPGIAAGAQRLPDAVMAMPKGRTVHLTLGTVLNHAPEVLAAAIAGLRRLPIDLVVTTGPGIDPAAFAPQPANVVLARYLPHSLLLPRSRMIVSQGGAGIMFGALAHGLPQLVLPQGADQFMNAEAAHRAGAALVLAPGEVTAEAVSSAAERLLAEPAFTEAATFVAAEIAHMPDADVVFKSLENDR